MDNLTALEYHALLAIAEGPLHGYVIRDSIESESAGSLAPRAGTLYRLLGRLVAHGLMEVTEEDGSSAPHPGLPRKYYALTRRGREALTGEARRLRRAYVLAERRLGLSDGTP
jgi:DNA-binding PadR family transcriptional regulator